MSTVIENTTPVTPVSTPPPASAPESAPAVDTPSGAPTAPESRRDIIVRALADKTPRSERPRDPTGKFLPNGTPAPQFPTPNGSTPAAAAPPARPAMPKSLRLELQPHWDAAPDELRQAIIQREADSERGVQPLKEKARFADEIANEFKPYETMLQHEGGTPQLAIRQLLKTAAIFRSNDPALKASAVAEIMRQFGIPLEHVQPMLASGAAAPPPQALAPQLISQLVDQRLNAFQQQQAEAANQAEVDRFAANSENTYFPQVQDWMASVMASEKFATANRGKSAQERLKAAYDIALRMDPELYQEHLAKQQADERVRIQQAQAQKAAVQIKGSPPSGPAPKPNPADRRGTIAAAMRNSR